MPFGLRPRVEIGIQHRYQRDGEKQEEAKMFPIDQQQQQHDYHEEHHKPHGDVREHLIAHVDFRSKGDIESKEKETQEKPSPLHCGETWEGGEREGCEMLERSNETGQIIHKEINGE
jgi:hypothetical protein